VQVPFFHLLGQFEIETRGREGLRSQWRCPPTDIARTRADFDRLSEKSEN
jgi:hypothetical protein